MREIAWHETQHVSGGGIAPFVVLVWVASNAEKIEDFVHGFFDGLAEVRESRG
ncbi:MAG: hypothetical protein NZM12_05760 [Steroidobacteraceae bacterium]|nr:hypothetical protein [Steroidobacteraceae bacterium]MDW8259532.1 hypothetical protein [Gammaproteobacteria bacterium]